MSYGDVPNPYASPAPGKPAPPIGSGKMRYLDAFNAVFARGDWFNTLLMGGVCMLIPVLNQIILFGYQYEIVETLHRSPKQLYPPFDFNRFSQYIQRGVWPFLIAFIVNAVVQVPMTIGSQVCMGGLGALVEENNEFAPLLIVVLLGVIVLSIAVGLAMALVMTPLLIRAGLTQEFGAAFKTPWIKDFIGKMWLETLLVNLFLIMVTIPVSLIGFMLCCVGILPAAMLLGIVSAHLQSQLYEVYLIRGGEPIPLKGAVPPLMMMPPTPLPPKY